ncbi:putative sugar nucleotidyl transferase [Carboxylicivirga caseinilyticus]|uniref:putative sugar nucleotidyl transferase n=1 Tax=Carboxylicivirga caseinilyticus TaxID=3417572 RepID=UPI003D32A8F2|nr:glucose-1-phosphate thymidylyltransferase [Marinilabiliaceae bacterium A049]
MNLILFDNQHNAAMLPLTFTRPQAALRCGILTIKEKWELHLGRSAGYLTSVELSAKYGGELAEDNLFVSASLLPANNLVDEVSALGFNEALVKEGLLLAVRSSKDFTSEIIEGKTSSFNIKEYDGEIKYLDKIFRLLPYNQDEIRNDFELITRGRRSQPLSDTVNVVGLNKNPQLIDQIFIEEGASVEYAYLNPQSGPIYIGKNAVVMEGAMLRGPIALCESSQISMGAKIYPGATIGPWSKVGGEMSNSIITGYSNKVHDGYLGDSIIGEWCNLGADTNTSNLKNDYALVKLWDYETERFQKTDLQFCGLVMGDYSRCAINTAFNSGTVVGVGSNLFGSGFPRNFVPSFVIGGPQGYRINGLKAVENVATIAMGRRNVSFTDTDRSILKTVFNDTIKFRSALR